MLARLEAEEAIDETNRLGIGTGSMAQTERQRVVRGWTEAISRVGRQVKTTRASLAAIKAFAGKARMACIRVERSTDSSPCH